MLPHHGLPILTLPDGALRIDGSASLALIAADPLLRRQFPSLADACGASPVRDITLAADLAQRGRCLYLQQGAPCRRNGGTECFALDGENRMLAILEGGPSWLVHPSQAGVALVALDASLELLNAARRARMVAAGDFFVLPTERIDAETLLESDERVATVVIPSESADGIQRFTLVRDETSGEILVSLAATRRIDGEVRLVLGGVSPRPYRVYNSIEEETTSGGLDEETIEGLAERALLDAEPLSENAYKVDLAAALLRDAIRELARD